MEEPVLERFQLAEKLASMKQNVAEAITSEFFLLRPDWVVRYGERGRQFCTADACFHMEFLAGAIEAGSPEAFGDYARWTAGMLRARGIAAHTLEEHFAQLEKHICPELLPAEREAVTAFLAAGRKTCTELEPEPDTPSHGSPLDLTRRAFLAAILSGQRHESLKIVEGAIQSGISLLDIYVDVFSASLHEVGRLWEQNKINVAQEHMATAITQYAIAMIYPRLVPAAQSRGNMVVTGVSGEQHQIGANLVADAMEANGWAVRFLGTNLPHSTVLATIGDISADMLCISTTLVANLPSAAELIRKVRSKLGAKAPRIALGGAAFRRAPEFVSELGPTHVFADLRQALAAL
jgi:methanogenic corrinoid protein MtbC1